MIIQRPADVATLIRSQRKDQGLSQKELASLANLTQVSISKIELGGDMHLTSMLRIMSILGIQLNALPADQLHSKDSEVQW